MPFSFALCFSLSPFPIVAVVGVFFFCLFSSTHIFMCYYSKQCVNNSFGLRENIELFSVAASFSSSYFFFFFFVVVVVVVECFVSALSNRAFTGTSRRAHLYCCWIRYELQKKQIIFFVFPINSFNKLQRDQSPNAMPWFGSSQAFAYTWTECTVKNLIKRFDESSWLCTVQCTLFSSCFFFRYLNTHFTRIATFVLASFHKRGVYVRVSTSRRDVLYFYPFAVCMVNVFDQLSPYSFFCSIFFSFAFAVVVAIVRAFGVRTRL